MGNEMPSNEEANGLLSMIELCQAEKHRADVAEQLAKDWENRAYEGVQGMTELREERDRLKREFSEHMVGCLAFTWQPQLDYAEIDRLKAECERMREAINAIISWFRPETMLNGHTALPLVKKLQDIINPPTDGGKDA